MCHRHLSADFIQFLRSSQLWRNFCQDADLRPEIREDCITVYYRGGALVRELRLADGVLFADVHHKFVPLSRSRSSTQAKLTAAGEGGLVFVDALAPLPLGLAEPEVLAAYKRKMDVELAGPERGVVEAIIQRTENQIIDQEIVFQEPGQRRDKIDLCHFDCGLGRLVFVEVKRKSDARLLQRNGSVEVLRQLAAYGVRLRDHGSEIREAFRNVVRWKRELGLGANINHVPEDMMELLDKPLLVIGNCSAEDVERITAGAAEWGPLMQGLPAVAAGYILCGKDGCSLRLANRGQARSFL